MEAKYEMIIYWSEEDQCFVAEVPELPGCMADGGNYQEVVKNAELAISEWVETARELGRPTHISPPPLRGRVRVGGQSRARFDRSPP